MWGREAKACLAVGLQAECEHRSAPLRPSYFLSSCVSPFFPPPHLFLSTPFSPPFLPLGLWPVSSGVDYPSGFQGGLPGMDQRLRPGEGDRGLRCPLLLQRRAGSTTDSANPQAVSVLNPCLPAIWAPGRTAGGSHSPQSPLPLSGGLLESSTDVLAPQPASNCQAESPRPAFCVWRPW